MARKHSIAFLALFAATSLGAAAKAQSYIYTPLNAPGATFTTARGINNSGVVTGRYNANDSFTETGGVFTNIDVPGAIRTVARGINGSGAVVGFYKPSANSGSRAFVRSSDGLTTFNFDGATSTSGAAINDAGAFVGSYLVGGVQHAFQNVGGAASEISIDGSLETVATGINNSGDVVGYYRTADHNFLGFLDHNNTITSFAMPGASVTQPLGINNLGEIVGDYVPTSSAYELPFAKIGSLYTLLEVPASVFANPTVTDATGVNDAGVIVGYSGLQDGSLTSGYVATPVTDAPLDIALAGGDASAPVLLPVSQISSISGAIGGGVTSQFYSFIWAGGVFGATLSLTPDAESTISYAFQLCSGSTCGPVVDSTTLKVDHWTGTLTDTLAAGAYTIGLVEDQPGVDPDFKLSFRSPVSSAAPEPAAWALLLLGFGGIGVSVRRRRSITAASPR